MSEARSAERVKYFTQSDVKRHNNAASLWVILDDDVFDLTQVAETETDFGKRRQLLDLAGKDVSHFFRDKQQRPDWKAPSGLNCQKLLPAFRQFLPYS